MQTEIEATYLDVNHEQLRARLAAIGAHCETPRFDMFRVVYDYPDLRLDKMAAWVRVRREADKVTMSFKHRQSESAQGMKEVELVVNSYEDACVFLESIGLTEKARQETRREIWQLDGCEIMLDEWPWIPPYVEIEGPAESSVQAVSEKLGFSCKSAFFDSADGVYQQYFDVTRTEISTVPITFKPAPDWLEAKRR
jgi:adenylate cyclase class 2